MLFWQSKISEFHFWVNYPFNYHIDDAQETMNNAVAPIIH